MLLPPRNTLLLLRASEECVLRAVAIGRTFKAQPGNEATYLTFLGAGVNKWLGWTTSTSASSRRADGRFSMRALAERLHLSQANVCRRAERL